MTDKTISLTTYYYKKTEIDNLFVKRSTEIVASENNPVDINEAPYLTNGFYYCGSNSNAAHITCGSDPLPSANSAFYLLVENMGNGYAKQTYTNYTSGRTLIRVRTAGDNTWKEWQELSKTTHTHGSITADGKIGSTANKPVITTTSGKLTTGSFGTAANTFCQGNDSRLSDARAPLSHSHGNITNDGKIGSTEGKPIITTTSGTLSAGEFESTASNIKMNGTANVGSLNTFARADHIHPSDTNKSKVSISRSLTSGTKLGTITIDGTATDLYSTNNTTYSAVTQSANGLMTKEDKQKADKSMMIGFGTASGTTSAYTVSITGATLTHGTIIAVYNAVGNNAASATLKLNSETAKPIYYNASAITAGRYPNKTTCLFMYNTTVASSGCWQMIYSSDTNTTYSKAVNAPAADTTDGSVGTVNKYALEDHSHPKSNLYAEASHTHTNLQEQIDKFKWIPIAPSNEQPPSKPYIRLFHLEQIGTSKSGHLIFEMAGRNNSKDYVKIRIDLRRTSDTSSNFSATPLEVITPTLDASINMDDFYWGYYQDTSKTYLDVFKKIVRYEDLDFRIYDDTTRQGTITVYNPVPTTTTDPNGIEAYVNIEEAATILYNTNYTSITNGATYTIRADNIIKNSGTSSQFLKADGSVDANQYSTTDHTHSLATVSAHGWMDKADKKKINESRVVGFGYTSASDTANAYTTSINTITGDALVSGMIIIVYNYTNVINNNNATLKLNNYDAKPIYYQGRAIQQKEFKYKELYMLLYTIQKEILL